MLSYEKIDLMSNTHQRVSDDPVYTSVIYGFVVKKCK